MASGVYYRLTDGGGNTVTFTADSIDPNDQRTIWEMEIPYANDIWLTDQITTRREASITFRIKPGTGQPYATVVAAITALNAITSSDYKQAGTLYGGDWNGSTWTVNGSYPFSYTDVLVSMVRYSFKAGEPYDTGEITGTITLKRGTIY